MENHIDLPHNQLILNTGEHHTGIIFSPFGSDVPSSYSAPRHAPISSGESGWIERPDAGRSAVTKDAPIGEPYCLLLLAIAYIGLKRCLFLCMLLVLSITQAYAQIASFAISTAFSGQEVTVNPSITSVPSRTATICWGVYHDEECTQAVPDIAFQTAPLSGRNAVQFTAPLQPGTYFVRATLSAAQTCGGLVSSHLTSSFNVYPADADVVLHRDAQSAATFAQLTDRAAYLHAYGAMRFSKTALNDNTRSVFERYNYFISFPFNVRIGDISGFGIIGTDWRILYYDGEGRAANGFFADQTDNWVPFGDTDDILTAGQGYLLQLNSLTTAAENDALWGGKEYATLLFPANAALSALEYTDITIPALSSAYQCTIDLSATLGDDADRRNKDSYWRCIGVPSFEAPSSVSELLYLYEWNTSDNSLTVTSSTGFAFLPTHAYLVQYKDAIIWSDVTVPAGIAARTHASGTEYLIELRRDTLLCDRTYIRLSDDERVTSGFDLGRDLIKERNAGKPNLYTFAGSERVAANVLPFNTTGLIPVGVQVEDEGTYTFSIPSHMPALTLIDHTAGISTNLALTPYSVHLAAGSYLNRFAIRLTDNEPTGMTALPQSTTQKILHNGSLYWLHNGQLFDLLGRKIR